MNSMLIIGAGEAGVRAALKLRELNSSVPITIIEMEKGDPYERPPLSKSSLTAELFEPKNIVTKAQLTEQHIQFIDGVLVESIDAQAKQVTLSNHKKLMFDKLLIATGASARTLPFANASEEDLEHFVFTLRTASDCQRIRSKVLAGQKVVLIGAGFIGLELAASLQAQQIKVTVLETQPRILQRAVPEAVARILHQAHHQNGTEIKLNSSIENVTFDHQARITLSSGEHLDADWLVVGIGSIPNINIAQQAELEIDNGIKVNIQMQTSHKDIYAAGDVCSFPYTVTQQRVRLESWRCAQEQAEVAAQNMLGGRKVYDLAPWFWSDQYNLGLQMVGLPLGATHSVTRLLGESSCLHFEAHSDGHLLSACGVGVGNQIAKDIKLAERLINQRKTVSIEELADPYVKLKDLLKK
ncbi:ferredoxin reductase [Marinomonas sp. CT5]|uniref:NAD(P)/FAD-dependent oxidoreductase n=1 Tax=Marinomonas sp. CT5 TaxID=2066133 RepID=UPI001BAEE658|nr:FAD-dependent oxidoreductase [Marinomonas sp. CT5]QUX97069.1 ferredoxin reductase [Marinomonas sp. CT5]